MLGNYALSAGYYDAYYLKALKVRRLIRNDFDRAFETCDLLLSPVTPTPAFKVGELINDPLAMYLSDIYTISANLAGLPGISVPAGQSDAGLPIGFQLLGPPFSEEQLLRAARMFERRNAVAHRSGLRCEPRHELHHGHRTRSARAAAHADQALLRLPQPLQPDAAQRADLPGLPRPARQPAGDEPPRLRAGPQDGHGPQLHDPARSPSGTASSITIPTCPRAIRSASTICPSAPRAGWRSRPNAQPSAQRSGSASSAPTSKRTPARTCTTNRAAAATARSTSTAPARRCWKSSRKPDLRSGAEAHAYLDELKLLLTYLEVSDCNMQEGSLRCDANVNLHVAGRRRPNVATPIVEIKNLNSFRGVEAAIEYEAKRQFDEWQRTGHKLGDVPKETRGWDAERGVTFGQRGKEEAADYRYFPDPDLVPVTISDEWKNHIRSSSASSPPPNASGSRPSTSSPTTTRRSSSHRAARSPTISSKWPQPAATRNRPPTGSRRTSFAR